MITTNTKFHFTDAENENFTWTYFDGSSGGKLHHKVSGNYISHMYWIGKDGYITEPVTGSVREEAHAFWDELYDLKKNREREEYEERCAQEKAEKEMAHAKALREAQLTGKPAVLNTYLVDCNDPREDCSMDVVTVYVIPDGTIQSKRQHTW
jgi:hypothetical protein